MPLTGSSQKIVVGAGGEGPWYSAYGYGATVTIPGCKVGDSILIWTDSSVTAAGATIVGTVGGSAFVYDIASAAYYLVGNSMVSEEWVCSVAGTVTVTVGGCSSGNIWAHRPPNPVNT